MVDGALTKDQAPRWRLDCWLMRRRWAGRHPVWASLLLATVAMYLIVPLLVAIDPTADNNNGELIWSLAISYLLYPGLVLWSIHRWRPGGRFHIEWSQAHGSAPRAVRYPRRRSSADRG
jgi:hypothetical protein